jgi:hypothetical protein
MWRGVVPSHEARASISRSRRRSVDEALAGCRMRAPESSGMISPAPPAVTDEEAGVTIYHPCEGGIDADAASLRHQVPRYGRRVPPALYWSTSDLLIRCQNDVPNSYSMVRIDVTCNVTPSMIPAVGLVGLDVTVESPTTSRLSPCNSGLSPQGGRASPGTSGPPFGARCGGCGSGAELCCPYSSARSCHTVVRRQGRRCEAPARKVTLRVGSYLASPSGLRFSLSLRSLP